MIPGEPVYHPSNKSEEQESFLVEIHSISGYSGSPVFVRPFMVAKLRPDFGTNTNVTQSTIMDLPYAGSPLGLYFHLEVHNATVVIVIVSW